MRDFAVTLAWCMKRGDMTISDLAVWFERPRATVNTWVNGRTPYGPSGREAGASLERLHAAIRNKRGFPIPATLSWKKRADYIKGVRDAAQRNGRVSLLRAAG